MQKNQDLICKCGKKIEITVPMYADKDDNFVCKECYDKLTHKIEIELIEHDYDLWSLRTNPKSYLNGDYYQRQSTHNTGINLDEFLADQTHGLYNGSIEQLEIIIKHKEEE
jgi:hypothetical protein